MTDQCVSCGNPLDPGHRFCSACGAGQPESTGACSSCGASHAAGDAFCVSCGHRLTLPEYDSVSSVAPGPAAQAEAPTRSRLGTAVLAAVVLLGAAGFAISNMFDDGTETGSQSGLPEWAPSTDRTAFCSNLEAFYAKWDVENAATSIADVVEARQEWRNVGFPDEVASDAVAVDRALGILIDALPGVDVTSDSAMEALLAQLEDDPEFQAGFYDSELAIRRYAEVCL